MHTVSGAKVKDMYRKRELPVSMNDESTCTCTCL